MNAPAYLPALLKLWRDGLIPNGRVIHVDVQHTESCMFLHVGVCDCRPFVAIRKEAA